MPTRDPQFPSTPIPASETQTALRADYDDCMPCRLMGSAAFTGLGIYSYASGTRQLKERETQERILKSGSRFGLGVRRAGVFALSAVLVGMGAYRLRN
ncbi:hypothetical protein MBLNU230_g4015t1 [Neophaeotheca triangularis]